MSINNRISQSRIFLFLGAGASVPFGGWLMGEFITNLISQLYTREDLYELLTTLASYSGYDLEAVLKELGDVIDKPYFGDKSRINFINNILDSEDKQEERLREMEKVRASGVGEGYVGSVEKRLGFSERYSLLVKICKELRGEIERFIFDHYGNLDDSLIVQTYKPIFDILSERGDKDKILPIFTTNYDRVIEDYGEAMHEEIELVDGFKVIPGSRKLRWDRNIFDDFLNI